MIVSAFTWLYSFLPLNDDDSLQLKIYIMQDLMVFLLVAFSKIQRIG